MPIPTLTAAAPKKKYELCPEGSYQACITRAYYCGTHANKFDPKNPPQKKIVFAFELDEPLTDGSGNHVMSTTVTFSLNEKSGLTKLLKPVMGSSYPDKPGQNLDINSLIDMRVMVGVTHSVNGDKTYANISGLTRVPRGMVPFNPSMDSFVWSYDDPADKRVPEWVAKFAAECNELGGNKTPSKPDSTRTNGHAIDSDPDGHVDGIPF